MILLSQCPVCVHKRGGRGERSSCAAFPMGIPQDLLFNRSDHRHPYPGDEGIRWQGKPGFEHPAGPLAASPMGQEQPLGVGHTDNTTPAQTVPLVGQGRGPLR
jgi:hypothetical protein